MIDKRNKNEFYWQKLDFRTSIAAAKFLQEQEMYCVSACSRFLKRNFYGVAVWVLRSREKNIKALLVHSKRSLLPVFGTCTEIPNPYFLRKIVLKTPIHSVQGLEKDVAILEKYLTELACSSIEKIPYNLMYTNDFPGIDVKPQIPGLIIRKAVKNDIDELSLLQAGYEKEEVLPCGADFNPAASRLNTERIFLHEQLFVAQLGNRLVGKINTSGLSFTRFQIGGVFVLPEFRGRGIARYMTGIFTKMLLEQGRGVSLFVKKANNPANSVYKHLGFKYLADYRINYH